MIVGIGLDLVELERIRKIYSSHRGHFLRKILTPAEIALAPANMIPWLAGRFAAKEACVKALGTGFCGGIGFQDMAILSDGAAPVLRLYNLAASRAASMGASRMLVSITHERSMAAAVVILES